MRIERAALRAIAFACMLTLCACASLPVGSQQLYTDFVLDVTNDRADRVKATLARGMDPNTVDPNGDPVLLVAARAGNRATVQALLDARAEVDRRNRFGDSAIMVAALNGHLDVVRLLRARGATLDHEGWTALIYAATGGHDDIVRYLLDQGARIDAASPNGTTALMMAVRESHASTVDLLLGRGANVNHRNETGATALAWAQRNDDRDLMERLRRAGAKP